MKKNKTDETLSLTAYRAGAIEAGGKTYTAPIIWRNGKIEAMKAQTPSELTAADLFQTTSDISTAAPHVPRLLRFLLLIAVAVSVLAFTVGRYDETLRLTIDPDISYSATRACCSPPPPAPCSR